jgi:cyclopropane-fatty-acyl-phospholipid synthase
MLPSRARFAAEAKRAGLRAMELRALGSSYAETLRRWRLAFDAAREAVRRQGFGVDFMRLWRFYFCFCEAGFLTRRTDVVQFKLVHDN